MISLRYTKNLFLRSLCIVYLFAFLSFYIQIPGLYGDNGILPARSVLENSRHKTLSARIHYQPTLLWLAPYIGLDTNYALDVLALLGSFLSFTGFVSQKLCTTPLFAGLWSLYFSLYQVGQSFVENNYDELLLEVGFLTLFIAPLLPGKKRSLGGSSTDLISFWLLRWLLFRVLVTTCLSKLISGCPKWWSLTALNYHFETMPLPSPLAWYSHYLPSWILKITTVFSNVCELFLPMLFFIPLRSVRVTSFIIELFLQICIISTGNFGYSNFLMVVLLLSLLDDSCFFRRKQNNHTWSVLEKVITFVLYVVFFYFLIQQYSLKLDNSHVDANIAFTKEQFNDFLRKGLIFTMYFALASLGVTVFQAVANTLRESSGSKLFAIAFLIIYSGVAFTLHLGSLVPLVSLHPKANTSVTPNVRNLYNRLHKLHAINQYGLFNTMVDRRQEIVFEGSNNVDGPWQEYHFLYKPGNLNYSLPYVAPHTPRLDWQLHWAAYSTYDKHPWLLSFVHRLLLGGKDVLALLDVQHSPFITNPPKYVRAILYRYKYTPWNQKQYSAWWQREKISEYLPALNKESTFLTDYLKARSLLPVSQKPGVNPILKEILDKIRFVISHFEATLLLWSVFSGGCAIIATSGRKSSK